MESVTISGLEELLFDAIKEKAPDDLYIYIKEDRIIWDQVSNETKAWIRPLAQRFRDKAETFVNSDFIIDRLRERRPDLAGVIINMPDGAGLNWLEKQVNVIREDLL